MNRGIMKKVRLPSITIRKPTSKKPNPAAGIIKLAEIQ